MIIVAKFASRCPKCSHAIAPGSKVEWAKGSPATHVDCSTAVRGPTVAATAPAASKTCQTCGHVERRNARGYAEGDWVRGGECQSCREERAMGY